MSLTVNSLAETLDCNKLIKSNKTTLRSDGFQLDVLFLANNLQVLFVRRNNKRKHNAFALLCTN